jgi:hypothetical protein
MGACLFYFDVISSYSLLSDIYLTKNISMKVQKIEPGRHKILGRRFFKRNAKEIEKEIYKEWEKGNN